MELHERIKYFRNKTGLSQMSLGLKVGKSFKTIQQYENGQTEPTWSMIVKIAKALDVNILALLPITTRDFTEELDRRELFINEFYGG